MTNNLRFDRFKKEIEGEVWGVILVTFSQNSVTKVISTGKKIKKADFKEFKSNDFNGFKRNNIIDWRGINLAIQDIINNKNPFNAKPKLIVSDGYLAFINKEISYIPNQSTKLSYRYSATTFQKYLSSINIPDIPLNELNLDIFKGYKSYMDDKLSYGTIKYYFTLHRAFIAKANDEDKTEFILSLKRFKLGNNGKKPTVLNDEDINKLRAVERAHPLFHVVQFSMLQLFSNGIRFGDCLLIKFSDFKKDYLEIHQMKTNRVLQVPYSPMLIDTVAIILGFDYTPSDNSLKNTLNDILSDVNDETVIRERQIHILDYIHNQSDRFLFDFTDRILFSYKKGTDMNQEQHKKYILHRANHNNHLTKIRKQLPLSVTKLSSHSMRYAYTRIALDNEIPLRTLSNSLGHSSVTITEKYIRNNFQVDNYKIIGEMMALKYKITAPDKEV
jgi:integrase